jgi:hypothetical protein
VVETCVAIDVSGSSLYMAPLVLKALNWVLEDMGDLPEGTSVYAVMFDTEVVSQTYLEPSQIKSWYMKTLEQVRVGGGTDFTRAVQLSAAWGCERLYIVSDLYGHLSPDAQVPEEAYWVDIDGEGKKEVPGGKGDRVTPLEAS